MREILFRAKRKLDDKWIYGNIEIEPRRTMMHYYNEEAVWVETGVFLETVGQYTGLQDKNGKKIFEGDICKHISDYSGNTVISVVTYTDGHFLALVNEHSGFELSEKLEVIGNIYDNPELLKGGVH